MKKLKLFILLPIAFAFTLFSCGKEESNVSAGNIMGTYDFISIHVNSVRNQTIQYMGEEIRTKSEIEYITENNSGTIEIDSKYFTIINIAYTANGTATLYLYDGKEEVDVQEMPVEVGVPASSGKSAYTLLSKSKIKMESSSAFMEGAHEIAQYSTEGTYALVGDILTLKLDLKRNQRESSGGIVTIDDIDGVVTVTLRKK